MMQRLKVVVIKIIKEGGSKCNRGQGFEPISGFYAAEKMNNLCVIDCLAYILL